MGSRASHLRSPGGKRVAGRVVSRRTETLANPASTPNTNTVSHCVTQSETVEKNVRLRTITRNTEGENENAGHPGELDPDGAGERLSDRIDQPFHMFYGESRDQVKGLASIVVDTLAAVQGNDRSACLVAG